MLNTQLTGRVDMARIARGAAAFALAFLAARAQVMLGLAPFALALLAAGLYAQQSPAALLLGCALGAARLPLVGTDVALLSGCALVVLLALALDRSKLRDRLREGPLCALLAGLGTLLPGLAAARLEVYGSLLALLAASMAVVSAPALRMLLLWKPGRPMGTDERAAAALMCYALLAGLCALWPPGGYALACLATLCAAHASMGAVAAVGALCACALLGGGASVVTAASVCVGGAAAGLLRPRGRHFAAPALVVGAGLTGLYAPEAYLGPYAPALAACAYVALPEAWLEAARALVFRPGGRERALREEASRALGALGAAFGELAAGVDNLPGEQAVLLEMRARLCGGCPGHARCWEAGDGRAVRLMCRALRDAVDAEADADGEDAAPPDVMRLCPRGERLHRLAREEARAMRMRRDADVCAGEMFRQAERILGQLSRLRARPRDSPPPARVAWGASVRPMEPGLPCGDTHLLRRLPDGRLLALICDGMGAGAAAREESERAVRLLWRFLSARVEPEAAMAAANALLIRRGAGDMFATVDLCLIDERSARARFWKLAASRSLVAREGKPLVVEGGRLPLGVIEGVEPACEEVELREGDVIVMGSDGAMDSGEGAVERALAREWSLPPERLSEELLRAAEAACEGRRDDMTVLCVRIAPARARAP